MALSEHKSDTAVNKMGRSALTGGLIAILKTTWGVDGPSQSRFGFGELGQ